MVTPLDSVGSARPAGPVPGAPAVALRLVATHDAPGPTGETVSSTRRVDFLVAADTSVAVEDGRTTSFPTARLWPEVRDRLPDVPHLRDDPHGRPAPPPREPGEGFTEACRAYVVLATVVTDGAELADETSPADAGVVAVRTWLSTDDELWSVTPRPDGGTDVRPAADGALGDLLIWDVTAAFEALVRLAGQAGRP